jgi:transketolase
MSLDGPTEEVLGIEPLAKKWQAFGWTVDEVDGHDVDALASCLARVRLDRRLPHVVIAHTIKGKGAQFMESGREWHLGYLAPPDRDALLRALDDDATAASLGAR